MKKYIYFGIGWLFVSVLAWFFILKFNVFFSNSLLTYIPKDFWQVFYLSVDENIESLVEDVSALWISWEYKDVLLQTNQIAAYQYISWDEILSFVLAKVKKDFDVNKAFSAGLLQTGDNYEYKELKKGVFVYWDKKSVEFISNYNGPKLDTNHDLNKYITLFSSKKNNIWFLSKIDTSSLSNTWNDLVSQYAWYLKYSVFVWTLWKEKSSWQFDILFNKELSLSKDYIFSNALAPYFNTWDLLFLQFGNITKLLWITKENLSMLLNNFATAQWIALPQDDITKLVDIFNWNVALKLWEASNVLWLWAWLIFENPAIYSVVYKYFPYLKTLISYNPMISWYVTELNETNKFWYKVRLPYMWSAIWWDVTLEQKDNNAMLSVFNANLKKTDKKDNKDLIFDDKTVTNFYVNFGKIIELYKRYSLLLWQESVIDDKYIWYFANKSLNWNVSIDANKLILKFNLK